VIYFDDSLLPTLFKLRGQIIKIHFSTSWCKPNVEDPIGLLSAMYQDGLMHELDEVYYGINGGKPRSFFEGRLEHFRGRVEYWDRKNDPIEISYNKGRVELLFWALYSRPKGEKPKFYVNNNFEPIDEAEFRKIRKIQKVVHQKTSQARAK
jgi:hypothetical protein